ncbi:hypothetical protein PAAG_05807 [Paracoccidioides lutzii Pb01]|uniref:Uncharacterized protein n=1 Tax=Paracoccidioides lutzii (strain ATCC MYA-826 / Pb01) TaxID=502779 RepID=C1H4W6_PARBA|nr:hypothetical protein PAAG_05807 [Paracoccidioides lutzii Pb01]EEH34760.2 hypothetical protein PAAG_05807 [Paracoccidioides lutzii Pb01]
MLYYWQPNYSWASVLALFMKTNSANLWRHFNPDTAVVYNHMRSLIHVDIGGFIPAFLDIDSWISHNMISKNSIRKVGFTPLDNSEPETHKLSINSVLEPKFLSITTPIGQSGHTHPNLTTSWRLSD